MFFKNTLPLATAAFLLLSCQQGVSTNSNDNTAEEEQTEQAQDQQQQQQQMQSFQQPEPIEVSDEELSLFAAALDKIQPMGQEAQQEMMQALESEQMDIQRFNEIQQAQQMPEGTADAPEVSSDEQAKYDKCMAKIQEIQEASQQKMESEIENAGLSVDRYQEILMAVQQDQELQQRLQEHMGG